MTNRSKLISTVTPVLNGEKFISGLIDNLNGQLLSPACVIVSDNCSDDNTHQKLSSVYKKEGWIVRRQSNRLSPAESFIAAIRYSSTEYVMMLPCDDRLHPANIKLADYILSENPTIDILGTPHRTTTSILELNHFSWPSTINHSFRILSTSDAIELMLSNDLLAWPFTGQIIRRSFLLDLFLNPIFPEFEGVGDIALSLTAVNQQKIIALRKEFLVLALSHPGQESKRLHNRWLRDYLLLAGYVLDLNLIPNESSARIYAFLMKAIPRHYATALLDHSQDPRNLTSAYRSGYITLLRKGIEQYGNCLLPFLNNKSLLRGLVRRLTLYRLTSILLVALIRFRNSIISLIENIGI